MDDANWEEKAADTEQSTDVSSLLEQLLERRDAKDTSEEAAALSSDSEPERSGGPLSDPRLLSALPTVLSLLRTTSPPRKKEGGGSRAECRDRLLIALKPFLSPERCAAVDTLLRISSLGNVLKKLT